MSAFAYRWVVVGLFWCVYFLNQADRRVMGIEDAARGEFARGDDPVEVFERHRRL